MRDMDQFKRMQQRVAFEAFTQGGKRLEDVLQRIPVDQVIGKFFEALEAHNVRLAPASFKASFEADIRFTYKSIRNVTLHMINGYPCIMYYIEKTKSLRWIKFGIINQSNSMKPFIFMGATIGKVIDANGNIDQRSFSSVCKNILKHSFVKKVDPVETAAKAYIDQYGSVVLDAFKKFTNSVQSSIDRVLASKPLYKEFPPYFIPEDADLSDMWFEARNKFDCVLLGQVITEGSADFFLKNLDEDELRASNNLYGSTDADIEDVRKMYENMEMAIEFGKQVERIVNTALRTFMQDLRAGGLKPTRQDYFHLTEEFLYEGLLVYLDSDFKA